jgi:hypothetical protein
MFLRSEFWRAIHQLMEAENRQIEIFIHHNHSRGVAREALLRSIILRYTIAPYVVRNGFVHTDDPRNAPHKQCDLLVYDPSIHQPYYQIEELVVAPKEAAKAIVEVKSDLDAEQFQLVRNMNAYARSVEQPLLSFNYSGWLLSNFMDAVLPLAEDIVSLPVGLVVHDQNYLAIRPQDWKEPIYFIVDFSRAPPDQGLAMATAYFVNLYELILRNRRITEDMIIGWLRNTLTIVPNEAKQWFRSDGQPHHLAEYPN